MSLIPIGTVLLSAILAIIVLTVVIPVIYVCCSLTERERDATNDYYKALELYEGFNKYVTFEVSHRRVYNAALEVTVNCEMASQELEKLSIAYHRRNKKDDFVHEAYCEKRIKILERIITNLQKYIAN